MRELNQIWERIRTFISSIQWDVRSTSILAIVLLVIAVVTAAQMDQSPQGDLEPIFANRSLTQSELDLIEAALGASELTGHRVVLGQLHVQTHQRSKYLAVLNEAGCIPETFHCPKTNAFGRGSIIEPSQKYRERMQHAKEREAELLIRAIAGVTDAYVRFDETPGVGLRARKLTTAMVGVTTQPNRPLDPRSVRLIQDMLLGLKAGLTEDEITVQDLTAAQSFRGSSFPSSLAMAQHNLELQWMRKLSTVLTFVPEAEIAVRVETDGANNAKAKIVRVSVGVPSDYVRHLNVERKGLGHGETTPAETEQTVRAKIQAAILPLLPSAPGDAGGFVAVNFFDIPADTTIARSSNHALLVTLIGLSLLTVVAVVSIQRFVSARTLTKRRPQLKVYSSDEEEKSSATTDERELLQSKLRAYVDDDPDAAAKSLAEFIDRAS